jgi:ketosteroid isomerase-like protein
MNTFSFRLIVPFLACVCFGIMCLQADDAQGPESEVENIERAFAKTMADRDFEAFRAFLSDEAVFFAGETPIRGAQAVAEAWQPYFEGPEAPFSWEPETVVVLDSGDLALSSGPVRNPAGDRVATFTSVWRLVAEGQWRIVLDKGNRYCPPPPEVKD